jgi:hypothetical protein
MVLTWDLLNSFNQQSPPKYNLGRKDAVQEKYDKHREWMKSAKVNVKSYINKKFNLPEKGIVIIENEFPYHCANGIKHYVVWIHDSHRYTMVSLESYIQQKLKTDDDTCVNYVFYQNIPQNSSIANVDHYHVFAKYD